MMETDPIDPLEAQIKAWNPALPLHGDLVHAVQNRILRDEYRQALSHDDPFRRAQEYGPVMSVWMPVQRALTNRWVACGYVAACVLLGLFFAHIRATAYWQHHSDELASQYVQLIDPATSIARSGGAR